MHNYLVVESYLTYISNQVREYAVKALYEDKELEKFCYEGTWNWSETNKVLIIEFKDMSFHIYRYISVTLKDLFELNLKLSIHENTKHNNSAAARNASPIG